MKGYSRSELLRLVKALEGQGASARRATHGWRITTPQGTALIPFTGSDSRNEANTRADIKRIGLAWPIGGDAKKEKSMSKQRTIDLIEAELDRQRADPRIRTFTTSWIADRTLLTPVTVRRYLEGKYTEVQRGRWELSRPVDAPPASPPPVTAPPAPPQHPDDVPYRRPSDREFIDSVNSWPVVITTALADMTLRQAVAAYRAAGMHIEVRVWRDTDTEGK